MESIYGKVLSFIKTNGPSLPIQIAKVMEKDTFYAGAILSDLLAKRAIKITTAKVGGSPLYYLPGQDDKLSKLYDHLPIREKEAYSLLQEKKVVKDSELQPAIRVALQMLKDFAVPFDHSNVKMWKWHLASDSEISEIINPKKPDIPQIQQQLEPIQQLLPIEKKQKKSKSVSQDDFAIQIQDYLSRYNIKTVENISQRKNKELVSVVNIPSSIGELEMFLVAKNKKKLANSDISLAHQKGQSKRLPTLLLTTGEITKKTQQHIEKNLKGLLLVRKI